MEALKTFAIVLNRSKLPKDIRKLIIGKCIVKKIRVYHSDFKEEFFVIFRRINGLYISWYPNGILMSKQMYKDGKKHGIFKEWNENGQLQYELMYKDGIRIN